MQVGDKVWYRGQFCDAFNVQGVVEVIDGGRIGVRLVNGNFKWANADQVRSVSGR